MLVISRSPWSTLVVDMIYIVEWTSQYSTLLVLEQAGYVNIFLSVRQDGEEDFIIKQDWRCVKIQEEQNKHDTVAGGSVRTDCFSGHKQNYANGMDSDRDKKIIF